MFKQLSTWKITDRNITSLKKVKIFGYLPQLSSVFEIWFLQRFKKKNVSVHSLISTFLKYKTKMNPYW